MITTLRKDRLAANMPAHPTVGVAIALYNGRKYLKEQLDSLRRQTWPADRVVLCDDGSTDGTRELVRGYIQANRLEGAYLYRENPSALGYARNFYQAADLCETDLICFCDQDDIWESDRIAKAVTAFRREPDAELVACGHSLIDADGRSFRSIRYPASKGSGTLARVPERDVVTGFRWPGMCMTMRADFWARTRSLVHTLDAPHDRALALLAASHGGFWFLDEICVRHRRHSANSGGEEHRARVYLNRSFKTRELQTSLDWLKAQTALGPALSPSAQAALKGYAGCVEMRLCALRQRNPLLLARALHMPGGYVSLLAIAADMVSILISR